MNVQLVIIAILFLAAIFYVGRIIFRSVTAKKSCGTNCKCGVDFSQVEINKASK